MKFFIAYSSLVALFAIVQANDNIDHYVCEGAIIQPTNDYHFRGTNLGGWLVLEPWITPSLFYQFLGRFEKYGNECPEKTGMDAYSFCTSLGAEEANKQLRRHWDSWVTEDDFVKLAASGINTIRVPIGDWMYKPYGPYEECYAGSLEQVDRILDLSKKYNLKVLLDIHGVIGSQNGFDNSGQAKDVHWFTKSDTDSEYIGVFGHWPYRTANWIGDFDQETKQYTSINYENIKHTLEVIKIIVDTYADNDAVIGLEPVNEPWEFTPLDQLKDFYWNAYQIIRTRVPQWIFLMHDSFQLGNHAWKDFMTNCPNVGIDTHIYQAWQDPGPVENFYGSACGQKDFIQNSENTQLPIVVGEWSLATDNCALWLNGFNDNLIGFPKVECDWVDCPPPYMGNDQPGAPPDPTLGPQGPFGLVPSTPQYGKCPIDKTWGTPDEDSEIMKNLAFKKINAFDSGHGWFFWNFKSELEPKWDFLKAVENGWIPSNMANLETNAEVIAACASKEFSPLHEVSDLSFSLFIISIILVVSIPIISYCISRKFRSLYSTLLTSSNEEQIELKNIAYSDI